MATHPILAKRQKLLAAIQAGSRDPFHAVLADGMLHSPSEASWRALAEAKPDKWAATVRSLGELSGYSTRVESASAADVLHELAGLVEVLDKRSGVLGNNTVDEREVIDGELVREDALQDAPQPPHSAPIYNESSAQPEQTALDDAPSMGADGWPL